MFVKLALAVLGALALAVGAGTVASAGDDGGPKKGVDVFDLTATTVQETDLDLGATGPSQGDRFVFSQALTRDGTSVGEAGGECTFVRLQETAATVQCVVTALLPGGAITVQGLFPGVEEESPGPLTFAITGGTGAYRTAHGEVTATFTSETVAQLHFEVVTHKRK